MGTYYLAVVDRILDLEPVQFRLKLQDLLFLLYEPLDKAVKVLMQLSKAIVLMQNPIFTSGPPLPPGLGARLGRVVDRARNVEISAVCWPSSSCMRVLWTKC